MNLRLRKASLISGERFDQHEPGAELVGAPLDLGEAVHRRGIDAGDQAEVEQQEAGFWTPGEKSFHLLVQAVGRAEEDIALQAHALDLAAVGGENSGSSGPRSSVERYSDPSKLNLIAFTRLALTAKVVQPITTPINTPAMKPI